MASIPAYGHLPSRHRSLGMGCRCPSGHSREDVGVSTPRFTSATDVAVPNAIQANEPAKDGMSSPETMEAERVLPLVRSFPKDGERVSIQVDDCASRGKTADCGPSFRLTKKPIDVIVMLHLATHFAVPGLVAVAFYGDRWRPVFVTLIATMVVDLDHLLAEPIYDPARCSIGFHPLHTIPAIASYVLLFGLPLLLRRKADATSLGPLARTVNLFGLGLLIHMALDWGDCVI